MYVIYPTEMLIQLFIFSAWDSLWPFSVLKPSWPLWFWCSDEILLLAVNLVVPNHSKPFHLDCLSFSGSFMSSSLLLKLMKSSNQDFNLTATHDKLLIFRNNCNHQITKFCNVLPLKLLWFPASKDKMNNLIKNKQSQN